MTAPQTVDTKLFASLLVETSANVMENLWSIDYKGNLNDGVPLRKFIAELLLRSKASYSTLYLSLYYLLRVKPALAHNPAAYPAQNMFFAALVLAGKYLQDVCFSNKSWAKLTGIPVSEITMMERLFLKLIDFRLHVKLNDFDEWTEYLTKHTSKLYESYKQANLLPSQNGSKSRNTFVPDNKTIPSMISSSSSSTTTTTTTTPSISTTWSKSTSTASTSSAASTSSSTTLMQTQQQQQQLQPQNPNNKLNRSSSYPTYPSNSNSISASATTVQTQQQTQQQPPQQPQPQQIQPQQPQQALQPDIPSQSQPQISHPLDPTRPYRSSFSSSSSIPTQQSQQQQQQPAPQPAPQPQPQPRQPFQSQASRWFSALFDNPNPTVPQPSNSFNPNAAPPSNTTTSSSSSSQRFNPCDQPQQPMLRQPSYNAPFSSTASTHLPPPQPFANPPPNFISAQPKLFEDPTYPRHDSHNYYHPYYQSHFSQTQHLQNHRPSRVMVDAMTERKRSFYDMDGACALS